MVDVSQFANVTALAVLVAIIVQLVKPAIQTTLIPLFAVVIGVVLALVIGWIMLGGYHGPGEVFSYVLGGFFSALLAVGGYEMSLDKLRLGTGINSPQVNHEAKSDSTSGSTSIGIRRRGNRY